MTVRKIKLSNRRGAVLVYSLFIMMLMCAFISLAVDYGNVQLIKTQLQRTADAEARGALAMYLYSGASSTSTYTQSYLTSHIVNYNPNDAASGISPTVARTWGYWNTSTTPATFVSGTSSTYPLAIKVVVSRTTANGNAVPLAFPLPSGGGRMVSETCNVKATAIAILPKPIVYGGQGVASTGDPWLAGMINGSGASDDDTAPANSPTAITVIAGSTLTFTNITGTVSHMNTGTATDPPTGANTSDPYWHHRDGSSPVPEGTGDENGVGDIIAPIDSMIGVFLNGSTTNATGNSSVANPSTRDFSTDMAKTGVNDIKVQQPFYIGDGKDASGNTQTFTVPLGATRMYLGIMDGYEWKNNQGSFSVGSLTVQPPIQLVQ